MNRRWGPLAAAGVSAVLVTGLFAAIGRSTAVAGCASTIPVVVASSEEKSTLLAAMATSYNRTSPTVDGECIQIEVERIASGQAEQALADGWNPSVDGPAPTAWTPAANSWTLLLSRQLADHHRPEMVPQGVPTLFKSPLVIGMPQPMAAALGSPGKAIGWGDIVQLAENPAGWSRFGHPEWGQFKLAKTDPEISTSGLHALIDTFFAASGRSSNLTNEAVADPTVQAYVSQVEKSVVHYGTSVSTFLQNLQAADDANAALSYVSAIAMEEKEILDYNHGNPLGDPSTLGKHLPPRVPLVAIYPKEGTLAADHPYVILKAPWVPATKARAADAFLSFLQAPAQQAVFQQAGFRDQFGTAGPNISVANGLQPDQPGSYLGLPDARVIERIQQAWPALRKRARILLLLDTSSSTVGASTSALATSMKAGFGALSSDDVIGSWEFSSNLDGTLSYRPVVPFGPVGQQASAVESELAGLRSSTKPAALDVSVLDAVQALAGIGDQGRIDAVVVVTNGRSAAPGDLDLDSLLRQLQTASETAGIHVFTVAFGQHPDTAALGLIARASRGASYDASGPNSWSSLVSALVSNF